jgi:hypothetical protein
MPKAAARILWASGLTLFLVGLSTLPHLLAASSNGNGVDALGTLYAVGVSIQPKNVTTAYSYDLVAYNSTGAPVASYTGDFPEVTFELPSGVYLLAATANGPAPSNPPVCFGATQGGGVAPPVDQSQGKSASSPKIAYPCYYANPPMEYGYTLAKIGAATTLTISTQPQSEIPTADVSVSVSFKNGTAASGADVSASVVGADWYWGGDSNLTMDNQTGPDGVARLKVPAVPLTVTASDDVQINLPQNQTTVQIEVGGQLVNVTVYYSPSYVYLSASSLLVPPQTSFSMVMTAQAQPRLIPYAVGSSTSAGTPAESNIASPSSSPQTAGGASALSTSTTSARLTAIPPIPSSIVAAQTQASTRTPSGLSGADLMEIAAIAIAGAIAAVAGVTISKRT